MNDTSKSHEEYTPPAIEVKGSVNELTQAGSLSGALDHVYPEGDPEQERPFLLKRVATPARSAKERIGVVVRPHFGLTLVGCVVGRKV